MNHESQDDQVEHHEVESLLSRLTPAVCEVPEATVMYRCGFEAGRRSVAVDSVTNLSPRRWHELMLAVCFAALMVGPTGYWMGQQRNVTLAESNTKRVADNRRPDTATQADVSNDSAMDIESGNSTDARVQEGDVSNRQEDLALEEAAGSWIEQQLARLLPSSDGRLSINDELYRSSYLTSRFPMRHHDFNRELTRLELSRAGDRYEGGDKDAKGRRGMMMTPWTPFSGEVTTQDWEGLIQ